MTLHQQSMSLMLMLVMGVWFGASFSVYQYFVHPKKKRRLLLLISDPIFWILQAVLLFALLLPVNQGQLRFYYFLAIALGFSFYKALIERPFMRFFGKCVATVVRTGRFIAKTVYHLLIYPLFFLLMLAYRLCRMTVYTLLKIMRFLFLIPLKLLRGVVRLIIPERLLIYAAKKRIRIQQKFRQWLSLLVKRK
ncbi:spore cortex biosynthesis protein YabQ [Sporolactobacillus sp. CPB3-1]|uniref:Spore cortex biosynthesis protein YabQ n=1 Tax=Sporolactobacillus mangiferae TaxID=2940498 RepID=A0ABT0MD21_9BACL|nr:spore cortex biosynthesis protein YabQ [Sporolactobacillus mangiferae]MCL1632473.1 spore cortex biosynthesis protein YabQ [Sporolactobacillus mangiferae]